MKEFLIYYYAVFFSVVGVIVWRLRKRSRPPDPDIEPKEVKGGVILKTVRYFADRTGLTPDDVGIRYTGGPRYAFDMGLRFEGIGDHARAAGYFEQALETAPQWGEAHFHLGLNYLKMGQMDKARAQWERLQTLDDALAVRLSEHLPLER